jgi:ubiquinone/menaquinone biosynthesis C-methylase UbiE
VRDPMPYDDNEFDYVYARLVLHYLTNQQLPKTLAELYRILKPGGKFFVVVRSVKSKGATREGAVLDENTGITRYPRRHHTTKELVWAERRFHTEESIKDFVANAGFEVEYVKSYDENLYADFMRTYKTEYKDNLVELLAHKPN